MVTIYDAIGLLGVGLIVYTYFLLQTRVLTVDDLRYSVYNLIGALLIIVSLTQNFNLPSFVIETIWVTISIVGIVRAWRKGRASSEPDAD